MAASGVILTSKEINDINEQLHFNWLPAYASFLLQNKLEEFTIEQLRISRQIKLPLLKHFISIPEEQLLSMSKVGNANILSALAENKLQHYIEYSLQRWMTNQIPQVSRDVIELEDITMVSFMRRTVFRNMMPHYTCDINKVIKILEELDRFTTVMDTISLNRLTQMQQSLYKQAQKLAHIGNWMWDLEIPKLTWSNEMYCIYELDPQTELSSEMLASLNHPDDQAIIEKNMLHTRDTKEPHDFYYRIILPDGRVKHLHAKGEARLNPEGKVFEMFGTLQDVSVQKQTEQLLSEKQDLIEKITTLAPSLISVYNIHSGKYIFINKAVKTLLGYNEEEAFEKGISFLGALIHPDDLKSLSENNRGAIRQANISVPESAEPIAEFTYRIKHSNGSYRWFRTYRTTFNRNSKNETEHVLSISVDITEQQHLHQRVQEEKAFAEMITELSIDRIQAFDRSFRYIIWNKECETYYGKTKAEVLGKTGLEVFPDSKDSVLFSYFERAMAGEFIHLKEQEFTFSKGWGEMFFIPLNNEQETFGALCIVHDITNIKKTNNELIQVNLAFEHAEEIAGMGHWEWNLKTKKLIFSDNQYRILGCNPQSFEPTIENFLRYVHPDDHSIILRGEEKVLRNNGPSGVLFRVIRADGSLRYFHSIGKEFTNELGENFLTGVNRDITEQHLLNLLLQRQNIQLEKNNKELESFNYMASHDIQEPLRKIRVFSELITAKTAKGDYEGFDNYFKRITEAAKHVQHLIDDLLTFSSIKQVGEEYKNIHLDDILKEVLNSLISSISETNAVIKVDNLTNVHVMPFQFRKVLENLLGNSIKYHRKGIAPLIEIKTQKVKGTVLQREGADAATEYVQISVIDNGIGFKQEYSNKIFEPFQRLHAKSEYPGTGIGLAICKKIIDVHNGFISVSSEENKGATFDVFLPAL